MYGFSFLLIGVTLILSAPSNSFAQENTKPKVVHCYMVGDGTSLSKRQMVELRTPSTEEIESCRQSAECGTKSSDYLLSDKAVLENKRYQVKLDVLVDYRIVGINVIDKIKKIGLVNYSLSIPQGETLKMAIWQQEKNISSEALNCLIQDAP